MQVGELPPKLVSGQKPTGQKPTEVWTKATFLFERIASGHNASEYRTNGLRLGLGLWLALVVH